MYSIIDIHILSLLCGAVVCRLRQLCSRYSAMLLTHAVINHSLPNRVVCSPGDTCQVLYPSFEILSI